MHVKILWKINPPLKCNLMWQFILKKRASSQDSVTVYLFCIFSLSPSSFFPASYTVQSSPSSFSPAPYTVQSSSSSFSPAPYTVQSASSFSLLLPTPWNQLPPHIGRVCMAYLWFSSIYFSSLLPTLLYILVPCSLPYHIF